VNGKVTFFFNIQNATTGSDLHLQVASIRLLRDGVVVRDYGTQNATFGVAQVTYIFSEAGRYQVHVYLLSAKTPVRADFPVEVANEISINDLMSVAGVSLVIVVAILAIVYKRGRPKSASVMI